MIFIGTVATAIHPLYYASGPFLCDVRNFLYSWFEPISAFIPPSEILPQEMNVTPLYFGVLKWE